MDLRRSLGILAELAPEWFGHMPACVYLHVIIIKSPAKDL